MIEVAQAPSTEPIGQVDSVKGDAYIVRVDGSTVPAENGQQIFLGDVVETGPKGAIGLVFVDDSTFSLADNGKMTIDELIYDPANNTGKSLFNVAQGVFTFVSGEIAKTSVDAMQIETPVATIGIRGTAGGGRIVRPTDPNLPPSGSFSNFRDPITGQAGEINVTTPTGSQTLNGVNSMTSVSNPFVPPTPPVKIPLAALRAVFGAAVAALPRPPARAQQQGDQTQEGGTNNQGGAGQQGSQGQVGDDILTESDPAQSGEADAQAAADAAAAAAFEEALAQGLDPGDALALAGEVAAVTTARFGMDSALLDTFSTQNAIDDVLVSLTQTISGGTENQGLVGGSGDDDISGDGSGESQTGETGGGEDTDFNLQDILDALAALTGNQEDTTTDTTDATGDEEENDSGVNTITATSDNDTLSGTSGTDEFLMREGSTLGGDDTLTGGEGTDSVTILDLQDGWLRYDPNASTQQVSYDFNYFDADNETYDQVVGSITLNGVEHIYIAPYGVDFSSISGVPGITLNVYKDGLLLPITSSDSLLGFVGIGSSYGETMTLASGYEPNDPSTPMDVNDVGGSIMFGLEGNDTLIGAKGVDILFGGADNDVLYGGEGDDILFGDSENDEIHVGTGDDYADGGDGNDTFYIGASEQEGGTLIGGAGNDEIVLSGTNDFTGVSISTIEKLTFSGTGSAIFGSSQIGGSEIGEVDFGTSGALYVYMDTTSADIASLTLTNNSYGTVVVNGTDGDDTITAAADMSQQTLTGGNGNDTITAAMGPLFMNGGEDSDTYIFDEGTAGADTIVYDNGSVGTDTIQLNGDNDFSQTSIQGIETLDLNGTSNTTISGSQAAALSTIMFQSGSTENLTIDITGSSTVDLSAKTLTGLDSGDSITINGSSGADIIVGSANADTITDGAGADTITGGGGVDIITLSNDSTADTIVFDSTTDFGDIVSGFTAGAGGDILDINVTVSRGSLMETLSNGGTLGSSTGLLGYSGSLNGISTAMQIALSVDISGLSAGDALLIGVSDGSDTIIWYWQDATSAGGNNDGIIDAAELTKVVTLSGVTSYMNLTEDNFAGFDDGLTNVSGTQTVSMTSGTDDNILGSSGAEAITLSGAAESGDSVDLSSGTDSLTLDATANTLSIANTETVIIQSGGTQNLVFSDATGVTIDNYSGSTSDANAVLNLTSGTGSLDQTWTLNFVAGTAGNFAASSIDMGAGTDTLKFSQSGSLSIGASQLGGVETLQLAGGTLNLTSTFSAMTSLSAITASSALSIVSLSAPVGKTITLAASDTATFTLNATSLTSLSDSDWSGVSSGAFGGGLHIGTNQTYILNLDAEFKDAFQPTSGATKVVLDTAVSSSVTVLAGTAFDTGNGFYFDGSLGTGTQTVSASELADTIIVGSGGNTVLAEGGDDTISISTTTLSAVDTIDGGTGTDMLKLLGGGTVLDVAFTGVAGMEKIDLENAVYDITLGTFASTSFSSGVIISSSQTSNSLTLDTSAYTGGPVNLDLTSSTANDTITTGSTNDTINAGDGDDIINTGGGADTIIDGGGFDTITGGAGADIIQLAGDLQSDVLRYVAADFGSTDTITGFRRGATNGDIFDLDIANTVNHGDGNIFQIMGSGDSVNLSAAVIVYTETIADYQNAATVAGVLDGLDTFNGGDSLYFMTTDGTDSVLWYWNDSSGTADGTVAAGEMQQVANISTEYSQSASDFTADNFQDVTT